MEHMVEELFIGTPRESTINIWDTAVVPRFDSLSYANLHDYQQNAGYETYMLYGSTQWPRYVTCNMAVINAAIGGGGGDSSGSCTFTCVCVREDCCSADDTECINWSEDSNLSKRAAKTYTWIATDPLTGQVAQLDWLAPDVRLIFFLFGIVDRTMTNDS